MIGHELVGRCVAVLEEPLEHRDCFQFSQFTCINLGAHFVYVSAKELGKASATEGWHLAQTDFAMILSELHVCLQGCSGSDRQGSTFTSERHYAGNEG